MGFEQQLDFKFNSKNHLVLGVQFEQKIREFFNIRYHTEEDISNLSSINQLIELRPVFFSSNGATFIQNQYWLRNNLALTTGVRLDIDEFYGSIYNPRMALVSSNKSGLNFKLLFGQGYKPPTIFELYDEWRGNSELEPERLQTSELELSYMKTKWDITINSFYNNLINSILVAENPDVTIIPVGESGQKAEYYQNLDGSTIIGFSLRSNWYPTKDWAINWNYHTLSDNQLKPIDNTAQHKFNVFMNYKGLPHINFNIRANWIGKIKAPSTNFYFYEKTEETIEKVGYDYVTEDNPDGYLDGHLLINLAVTGKNIKLGNHLKVEPFIKIDNLLNTKYAYIGRQSGSGIRPESSIQSSIFNPNGFIPAYHPQSGFMALGGLRLKFN